MALRDHEPVIIEEFNGLFQRGTVDSVPLDHFQDCNNIKFVESGVETRDGIDTFLAVSNIIRMYNYKMEDGESLLALNDAGEIYHALLDGSDTVYGPILTIAEMEDFGFEPWAGRAYITPFKTYVDDLGRNYQKGLENEFLYVYKGDGTPARKAAADPPSSDAESHFIAFNSQFDGLITKGVHLLTVVTNTGTVLAKVFPVVYSPGAKEIECINIPLGAGGTTSRNILMTHAIDPKDYVPDQTSYTYYVALTIADNTTASARVSITDAGLTAVGTVGSLPTYTGMLAETSDTVGYADIGFHLIAVVYETDTGYLTALGPENFASINVVDIKKAIDVTNIPVSDDTFVTKRHLVATHAIYAYNGDQTGYQFFFIPDGTIEDNTTTTKTISFYDADLFDDASHLIDNFAEIPAGVSLTTYNSRLVLTTTFEDISVVYLSAPGEPEAFDQVDGVIIAPLDGNAITAAQTLRDVLYVFKKTKTFASVDNQDEPSTWPIAPIDQGIGASVHGVATILDSGGVNVDFLIILDYSGVMIFNGAYARPELSWKITDLWLNLDRNNFHLLEVVNDTLNQRIYIVMVDGTMLYFDYTDGLSSSGVKITPWSFDIFITSIAIYNTDVLLLASTGLIE